MAFEAEQAWRLDRRVAIRPEPFGALAYHFGTRQLSFLKTRKLLAVVQALDEQPTALAASFALSARAVRSPPTRPATRHSAGGRRAVS
jgi:putative mycofactocin binding protein MftB